LHFKNKKCVDGGFVCDELKKEYEKENIDIIVTPTM